MRFGLSPLWRSMAYPETGSLPVKGKCKRNRLLRVVLRAIKQNRLAINRLLAYLWSWRDSNSRPNEELICFLHVYLRLHCRGRARPKPPTHPLSSKVSPETRGLSQTISDIAAPPDRNASEPQHPGDVTSPQLLQGLSLNLLYFD